MLQIFSPLGHALGLSVASARLEDLSFEILFREPYSDMRDWMRGEQDRWLAVLTCMKAQAQKALDSDEELRKLAVRAFVSTRAKSSYSLMKKLLTLSGAYCQYFLSCSNSLQTHLQMRLKPKAPTCHLNNTTAPSRNLSSLKV